MSRPYTPIYGDSAKITWENSPSTATPLASSNLNKESQALHDIDARLVEVGNGSLLPSDIPTVIKDVAFDSTTGIFTFTRYNDTTFTLDTLLEKVVTNWTYNAQTQCLVLTLADGTTVSIDISSMISEYDFTDSSTVAFTVANHTVTANIVAHSIGDTQMETGYLSNCLSAVSDAEDEAENAQAWAEGKRGNTDVPSTDPQYHNNAKYYSGLALQDEQTASQHADASQAHSLNSEAWADGKKNGVDVPSTAPQYHNNAKYWADQAQAIVGGQDNVKYTAQSKTSAEKAQARENIGAISATIEHDDSEWDSETTLEDLDDGTYAVYGTNQSFGYDDYFPDEVLESFNDGNYAILTKQTDTDDMVWWHLLCVQDTQYSYRFKEWRAMNDGEMGANRWIEVTTDVPIATSSTCGIVKPSSNMTVDANGVLDVKTASSSQKGIAKVDDISIKVVNDKLVDYGNTMHESTQSADVQHFDQLSNGWHMIGRDTVDEQTFDFNDLPISATDIVSNNNQVGVAYIKYVADSLSGEDVYHAELIYQKYSDSSQRMWVLPIHSWGSYTNLASQWIEIKESSGEVSNPNLLDNAWFKVNQKGVTSGRVDNYQIDRWKASYSGGTDGNGTVSVVDGTVTMKPYVASGRVGRCYWFQRLTPEMSNYLAGKQLTLSVRLLDGTIHSVTGLFQEGGGLTMAFHVNDAPTDCRLYVAGFGSNPRVELDAHTSEDGTAVNPSVSFTAMKLEEGSVSTLYLDTTPPNYDTELSKCQDYSYAVKADTVNATIALGQAYASRDVRFVFTLPKALMTTPTLKPSGTWNVIGTSSVNVSSNSIDSVASNVVTVKIVPTSNVSTNAVQRLVLANIGDYVAFETGY